MIPGGSGLPNSEGLPQVPSPATEAGAQNPAESAEAVQKKQAKADEIKVGEEVAEAGNIVERADGKQDVQDVGRAFDELTGGEPEPFDEVTPVVPVMSEISPGTAPLPGEHLSEDTPEAPPPVSATENPVEPLPMPRLGENLIVGGQAIHPTAVGINEKTLEGAPDFRPAWERGFLNAMTDAANVEGITPEQRDKNIQDIAEEADRRGVSREDVLRQLGELNVAVPVGLQEQSIPTPPAAKEPLPETAPLVQGEDENGKAGSQVGEPGGSTPDENAKPVSRPEGQVMTPPLAGGESQQQPKMESKPAPKRPAEQAQEDVDLLQQDIAQEPDVIKAQEEVNAEKDPKKKQQKQEALDDLRNQKAREKNDANLSNAKTDDEKLAAVRVAAKINVPEKGPLWRAWHGIGNWYESQTDKKPIVQAITLAGQEIRHYFQRLNHPKFTSEEQKKEYEKEQKIIRGDIVRNLKDAAILSLKKFALKDFPLWSAIGFLLFVFGTLYGLHKLSGGK